ncbi:Wzt carbohydrate-binding domain-containing protein [Sodalis ligni]|uniref:Wzt carbohydrate-binding domain-containing protein n=1 Tax=Sodalis ligni TaxID=2697027 RepID=UPI001BDE82ED|nr:Wzt carbohydrate-binding domain-containing protein [Sodalis ligni]
MDVFILDAHGEPCSHFDPRDKITVVVRCHSHADLTRLNVGLRIRNKEGVKFTLGAHSIKTWLFLIKSKMMVRFSGNATLKQMRYSKLNLILFAA